MMKLIVAVSGGVDSVVLLDKLVASREHELIVAHFDHGIRADSAADARFVGELAQSYGLVYETKREELGEGAGELVARERRYAFLRYLAENYDAKIVTAHHQDDVLETIAINLVRGTNWRGLAVFGDNPGVLRPLLDSTKQEIYDYAVKNNLEWVEDETNQTDKYLRNRLRRKLGSYPADKKQTLLGAWRSQLKLRRDIEQEVEAFISPEDEEYSRYLFINIDDTVALELLRSATSLAITYPQAERGLLAIKTYPAGTSFQLGGGVELSFKLRTFTVKTL